MKFYASCFIVGAYLFVLAGCAQHGGNYQNISIMQGHEIEAAIIKNKTTLNDLYSQFGKPTFCNESKDAIRCGFYKTAREYRRTVYINIVADRQGLITDYNYTISNK